MGEFRDFLRENNFLARVTSYAMIALFWRLALVLGRWCGYEYETNLQGLKLFGIAGIWVGVVIGYQLYYRWLFPEKRQAKSL